MNRNHTSRRRAAFTAAWAAFGVASLGVIGVANADPQYRDRDRDGLADRFEDDRGYQYDDYDEYQVGPYGQYHGDRVDLDGAYSDLDRYTPALEFNRHARIDVRRFDHNRSGKLESWEREAYWRTLADMGIFGRRHLAQAVAGLAKALDRDGDGRLTRREFTLVRRFIAARRMFEAQDRDNDDRLYRGETSGFTRNQFHKLDGNHDRRITKVEVRNFFINLDRPEQRVWSWRMR